MMRRKGEKEEGKERRKERRGGRIGDVEGMKKRRERRGERKGDEEGMKRRKQRRGGGERELECGVVNLWRCSAMSASSSGRIYLVSLIRTAFL
jgi:hypothetical protein